MSKVNDITLKFVALPVVVLCAVGATSTGAAYAHTVVKAVATTAGIGVSTAKDIGPSIKAGVDAAGGSTAPAAPAAPKG